MSKRALLFVAMPCLIALFLPSNSTAKKQSPSKKLHQFNTVKNHQTKYQPPKSSIPNKIEKSWSPYKRLLYTTGMYNRSFDLGGEYAVMDTFIRPGMTLFDVGANLGTWSFYTCQKASRLNIYAFEPVPSIFSQLKNNLSSCAKTNKIHFNGVALSNKSGQKNIFCYERSLGVNSFFLREANDGNIGKIYTTVSTIVTTLDNFCAQNNISKIDFLKIDAEGADLLIIEGGYDFLKRGNIQFIQFEHNSWHRFSGTSMMDYGPVLSQYGYHLFIVKKDGIVPITSYNDKVVDGNVLAIHNAEEKILPNNFITMGLIPYKLLRINSI